MPRRETRGVAAAVVLLLASGLAAPPAHGAQEAQPATRVAPPVRAALVAAGAGGRVPVVVEYEAPPPAVPDVAGLRLRAAAALAPLARVEERGLEVSERFWIVPAAAGTASAEAVEALAAQPEVRRVYLDDRLPVGFEPAASVAAPPSFTSDAMRTIGADAVWERGVTGEGTTVAFFDTGVDGAHPLLASRWRGRRASVRGAWFDPFRRAGAPQDLIGHGTQVAAAGVGSLPAGDTLVLADGTRIVAASDLDVVTGTAPRAEWIAARIFDSFGGVYTRRSVILQAFQWALDPDGDASTDDAPDVINNSWGIIADPEIFDACSDVIYSAIDAAEAAGIAVVFAAGNAGPAPGSVQPPAARDDPERASFAAGASSGTGGSVAVASFSGRGPSPCNGGIKPELIAPGTVPEVRADGPRTARLSGFSVQGTSFSAPQVSGALALLRQLRPADAPEAVKRTLLETARDLGPVGPDNDAGFGLLDVPAAVERADASFLGPLVQVEGTRLGEAEALVVLANRGSVAWPGGRVELTAPGASGAADVGPIPAGARRGAAVPFAAPAGGARVAVLVTVRDPGGAIRVSRAVLAAPPNAFGGFVLAEGPVRAAANDFGRLGRIAALPGFEWRGEERLPAGAFFVAAGGRLSDGIYVTALAQPELKPLPPAAETDWAPERGTTDVGTTRADVRFDDLQALQPVGLRVDARLALSGADAAGALTLTAVVRNVSGARLSDVTPGVFADWDLPGGERLRWSDALEALVAEPVAGGGPVALLASDAPTVARADVPLGTPEPSGFYREGSGVLADGDFAESVKLDLARGGPDAGLPGAADATDRAALFGGGPFDLPPGGEALVRFWLVVADDEATAAARLAALRAEEPEPPSPSEEFAIRPPFPNPLRVGEGSITFPVDVPAGRRRAGESLRFEIYDLAGRRLFERRIPLDPSATIEPPRWDGRLGGGGPAAAGVYLFVFRLEDEVRSGRVLLLR